MDPRQENKAETGSLDKKNTDPNAEQVNTYQNHCCSGGEEAGPGADQGTQAPRG